MDCPGQNNSFRILRPSTHDPFSQIMTFAQLASIRAWPRSIMPSIVLLRSSSLVVESHMRPLTDRIAQNRLQSLLQDAADRGVIRGVQLPSTFLMHQLCTPRIVTFVIPV
jgi:antibiotic biosynthesis monooxygenase (ABM) superfamily enzyme